MPTEEIVNENGTPPPSGEQRTVADLIATVRSAQRWGGKRNPSRFVLAECVQALTDLALQLRRAHAEIDYLKAVSMPNKVPPTGTTGIGQEFLANCNAPG